MSSPRTSWIRPCDKVDVMRPYNECWEDASQCTPDQLGAYFLAASENGVVKNIPMPYYECLFAQWTVFMANARGRDLLRTIIGMVQEQRNTDQVGSRLSEGARIAMRRNAPDMYHELFEQMFMSIDLQLYLDIETQLRKAVCRKTPSPEHIMDRAVTRALCINFFERAYSIHTKWAEPCFEKTREIEWAIPPQAAHHQGMWYVPKKTFEKRIEWCAPFALLLIRAPAVRALGAVISGSILPLCVLKHEVYTGSEKEFRAFVNEVYRGCSLDFFVQGMGDDDNMASVFLAELCRVSGNPWSLGNKITWAEDDDWMARNRRGTTYYFNSAFCAMQVQLIVTRATNTQWFIAHQHLPCVRAYYNGSDLYTSASCFESWMTKFISDAPLFGSHITQQRKSKTVFKYAVRGWGFSTKAVATLQLPSTLYVWLQEWGPRRALPWYHPLYNPDLWHKAMSEESVKALIDCAVV